MLLLVKFYKKNPSQRVCKIHLPVQCFTSDNLQWKNLIDHYLAFKRNEREVLCFPLEYDQDVDDQLIGVIFG